MGYIRKLAENKYFCRVSKGTGDDRRQHSRTIRGTMADAKRWVRENETKLDLDLPIKNAVSITFADFFEKWKKQIAHKFTANTVTDYSWNIEYYFLKQFGKLRLDKIKRADIQNIVDKLRDKGYKRNSIDKAVTSLSSMLTSAVKQELLTVSPCKNLELPRKDKTEIVVLDEFEVPLFISACNDHEHGLKFEFALETGMRPSEWLALNWNDIEFQNNIVKVSKSVHYKTQGKYYFKETKVKSSNRQIEISSALIERLKIHRDTQPEQERRLNLIFPTSTGLPIHYRNLHNPLREIATNAGITKNLTLYALRHTTATLLLLEGENAQAVAARLGDKSVITILDNYAHFLPTMQKRATDKLSKIMRG